MSQISDQNKREIVLINDVSEDRNNSIKAKFSNFEEIWSVL